MGFDKGQIWTVLSGLPGLPKKAQRSNQGYSVVLYGLFGLIETRECMQGMLRERFWYQDRFCMMIWGLCLQQRPLRSHGQCKRGWKWLSLVLLREKWGMNG
ncbi:hypothetical protein ES288_A04G143300v1 [Gossypium darwinii]|uniref:Uncharacterized protein n=1 Tax=Gossypium darwinii TaxID=34276 RepID=A0A5D2GXJ0_GOSDA|nr:hypothetical protein ES288_A04G143300v1 [Gossypium darwinii]